MTSNDLIEACDILVKLKEEFSTEEAKLQEIANDHEIRIDELDQQITTFRRNEDVDFRVFSPRNISTGTSDKIKVFENEKKQLEREKMEADKQLRYYSGKTDMISKVLDLLRGDLVQDSEDDSDTVRRSRNPFAFLDEDITQDDKVSIEDDVVIDDEENVEDLFDELIREDNVQTEKKENTSGNGVPVEEVERVCHKVEFCEKIISNDGIRAKLEIKNIVADLKDLIRGYS